MPMVADRELPLSFHTYRAQTLLRPIVKRIGHGWDGGMIRSQALSQSIAFTAWAGRVHRYTSPCAHPV